MTLMKTIFIPVLAFTASWLGFQESGRSQEPEAAAEFEAAALLIVHPSAPPLIGDSQTSNADEERQYANTQKVLLKSPFVLAAALREPGISSLSTVSEQEEPLQWLAENIRCEFVSDSRILRVALRGDNPQELKKIVDAVTTAYLYEIAHSEKTEKSKMLQTSRKQLRSNEQRIKEKSEIIHRLAEEVGSADSNQIRLLHELSVHELKSLFDRRERLTEKMEDVSDELHVLETLAADNDGAADDELQNKTRIIRLRRDRLSARVEAVEARISKSRQELEQAVGFSADLEARKSDLMSLQKLNAELAAVIARLELDLKAEVRVQRVQPAVVMRLRAEK